MRAGASGLKALLMMNKAGYVRLECKQSVARYG